jgi:hypothetical protein
MDDTLDEIENYKTNFTNVFKKITANSANSANTFSLGIELNFILYNHLNIISYIRKLKADAIILSGSIYRIIDKENNPQPNKGILLLGLPILGLCYGYEWLIYVNGGKIGTFSDKVLHNYKKYITMKEPFSVPKRNILLNILTILVKFLKDGKDVLLRTQFTQ